MIFCDAGNSVVSIYAANGACKSYEPLAFEQEFKPQGRVYFINVNERLKNYFAKYEQFIDLEPLVEFKTSYQGLGIDRKLACLSVEDAAIIDAGSAITIDIMSSGLHLGGTILPGLGAYRKAYKDISSVLDKELVTKINLSAYPQSTAGAISWGVLHSIISCIKTLACDKSLIFTGGDGSFLASFFDKGIYNKILIYQGFCLVARRLNLK